MGKSSLFNKLVGKQLALVDKTPGLTRDRREAVFHDGIFDIPIRLVDTAGFEGQDTLSLTSELHQKSHVQSALKRRKMNRHLLEEMLRQTRNALIYADLALFVMDAREGITWQDVALYNWLTMNSMRLMSDEVFNGNGRGSSNEAEEDGMDEFETPAHVPSIIDQALMERERADREAKLAAARDPLERQ